MSEIKIKIGAELDVANVTTQIQGLVKDLEQGVKLKVDDTDFRRFQSTFDSARSQLEKSGIKMDIDNSKAIAKISDIEKSIGNVKDVKIKTTIDKDGNVDKVNVQFKEIDGTAKSIQSTLNKKTGFFDTKTDSTVKDMESIDTSLKGQLAKTDKLLSYEKKLNALRDRSSKITDKDSNEYRKAEQDIVSLTQKTEQYKNSLNSVSGDQMKQLNTDIKAVDVSTDELWKTQQKLNREKFDFNKVGGQMESVGRGIMALSAPILGMGVASIKAANTYETSFTNVRKTTQATEQKPRSPINSKTSS